METFNIDADLNDVDKLLQNFLDTHFVGSVSFSYSEYDEATGLGTRTTIEKNRYTVEEFE